VHLTVNMMTRLYLQLCDLKITIGNTFQIMVVERITRHLLQGKVLLQIEVSMPPEMLIR
jgi:hypothetical protein